MSGLGGRDGPAVVRLEVRRDREPVRPRRRDHLRQPPVLRRPSPPPRDDHGADAGGGDLAHLRVDARARRPRSRGRAPGRSRTRGWPAACCRPAASARSAPSCSRRREPGVVEDPHPRRRRLRARLPRARPCRGRHDETCPSQQDGEPQNPQRSRSYSANRPITTESSPRVSRSSSRRQARLFNRCADGERARPEEVRPSSNTIVDPGAARERAWTARAARSLDAPTQHSTTTRVPLETRRETDQERHPARRATILLIREGFPGHSIPRRRETIRPGWSRLAGWLHELTPSRASFQDGGARQSRR